MIEWLLASGTLPWIGAGVIALLMVLIIYRVTTRLEQYPPRF